MPTVQLKHSFGEPTLMGPGGAPKGRPKWVPTRLSPKCALYGINQFVSMHTLQHSLGEPILMGPPGALKGTPNGALPHPAFTEIHLEWYQSTRLESYSSFTTFLWRTDPHGAPGAPKGTPNGAPTRLLLKYALYGINEFPLDVSATLRITSCFNTLTNCSLH